MTVLHYLTERGIAQLERAVESNLSWYYRTRAGRRRQLFGDDVVRTESIQVDSLAGALTTPSGSRTERPRFDGENALTVYGALRNLTPQLATNAGIWIYLCHAECAEYVSKRWMSEQPGPEDAAAKNVLNHFFMSGERALRRDNGIARLWWMGYIAHRAAPDEPRSFLDTILHSQDIRSSLLERPAVSTNVRVLRAIYLVMKEHREQGSALLEREAFREWMRSVNRQGGMKLLDHLSDDVLDELLQCEAKKAIDRAGGD